MCSLNWYHFLYVLLIHLTGQFHNVSRLPSNDGNASKGKQQTSEPVHILKRSFARTVSVVCLYKSKYIDCMLQINTT